MDAANLTVAADSGPIELKAIYQENADYDIDSSTLKAGRFIVACRAILALPVDTNNATEGVRFNRELIADQLAIALRWNKRRNHVRPRTFTVDTRYCR